MLLMFAANECGKLYYSNIRWLNEVNYCHKRNEGNECFITSQVFAKPKFLINRLKKKVYKKC